MPGAKFKRQAAVWYQYVMDLTHVPYAAVKQAMVGEVVCARSQQPLTLKFLEVGRHGGAFCSSYPTK